jgi:hypothetical protein
MRAAFDGPPSAPPSAAVQAQETVPLRPPSRDTAVLPVPAQVPAARELPSGRRPPRRDLRRAIVVASVVLALIAAVAIGLILVARDNGPTTPSATTQAATPTSVTTNLPAPLARALEQLERVTRP